VTCLILHCVSSALMDIYDSIWLRFSVHDHIATHCNTLQHIATHVTSFVKCSSVLGDIARSHVCHDPFTCVTWPIHMCDMTHSHVRHDPFTCVKSPIHMCDMTHSHVWHDSFYPSFCRIAHEHIRFSTFLRTRCGGAGLDDSGACYSVS